MIFLIQQLSYMYLINISHYCISAFFFEWQLLQELGLSENYGHYQQWGGCNDQTCSSHSRISLIMNKYAFHNRYIFGTQIYSGLKMNQSIWKRGCIPIWPFKYRHILVVITYWAAVWCFAFLMLQVATEPNIFVEDCAEWQFTRQEDEVE